MEDGAKTALASDYDGTLQRWHPYPHILPEDVAAIRAFRAAGFRFGICTGRCLSELKRELPPAIEPDFLIVSSGAWILGADGTTLRETVIPNAAAQEILDFLRDRAIVAFQAAGFLWTARDQAPAHWRRIASAADIPENTIHAISAEFPDLETAHTFAAEISARFGTVVAPFQNITTLDIAPAACSKGAAVTFVKQHLGITRMGGIGDSFNDIPLLQASDVAFTFPASPPAVRACADRLVASVAEAIALLAPPAP